MQSIFIKVKRSKKSIFNKLSSVSGKLSWKKAIEADTKNSLHISVVNDLCESTFGILKDEIKRCQNIYLT